MIYPISPPCSDILHIELYSVPDVDGGCLLPQALRDASVSLFRRLHLVFSHQPTTQPRSCGHRICTSGSTSLNLHILKVAINSFFYRGNTSNAFVMIITLSDKCGRVCHYGGFTCLTDEKLFSLKMKFECAVKNKKRRFPYN